MVLLLEEKNLPDHKKLREDEALLVQCAKCQKKKVLELTIAYISKILF